LLKIGGIEPEIGPVADKGAVEEGVDAVVDIFGELADGALADPREPHGLHQIIDPPGGAAAPVFWTVV